MGEDRWNDRRYGDEPLWGSDRRQGRPRASQDWGPEDYDRYADNRGYGERDREHERERVRARAQQDEDDTRFRPFGDTGPISTRSGAYTGEGRPYGQSGRYDELSPGYRDFEASQRRIHRGDYDPDRYTPNAREARGDEPRTWWDRAQDELGSWFGDENARRRREWDERQADMHPQRRSYSGFDERPERRGPMSGLDYRSEQRSWGGLDYKGEHRGRGPKGYQRSDSRIADDLNDRLTDDPYLDASDIDVKVKNAEVTLEGFVARREDKRRAEDLAETILGVSHVQNNLRVKPASSIPAGDYIVP